MGGLITTDCCRVVIRVSSSTGVDADELALELSPEVSLCSSLSFRGGMYSAARASLRQREMPMRRSKYGRSLSILLIDNGRSRGE